MNTEKISKNYVYFVSLISGGVAGLVVDVVLFPIDTIKTRLQSERGFIQAGGFRRLYNGLGAAAVGSVPTASLFFCTYETIKKCLIPLTTNNQQIHFVHMASASIAELVACLIRVPIEIVKQRRQALSYPNTSIQILRHAYKTEGIRNGIYRGFGNTLLREIPFSLIQFPLWEYLKYNWPTTIGTELTPFSVAICGALAGGFAAACTTPLDVIKTRIMLAERSGSQLKTMYIIKSIYSDKGIKGLFAGFVPRVIWITIGGAIFFGSYDFCTRLLTTTTDYQRS